MKYYTIGSFSLPASWASIVIAVIITFIIIYFRKNKLVLDWFGNVIFIWFMTWKLSVILFQFKLSISNPLNILYFHGGVRGYWLGLALALLYLLFKLQKHSIEKVRLAESFLWMIVSYEVIASFLVKDSILLMIIQLTIGSCFLYLFIRKAQQPRWCEQLFILFAGVQALIYSIQNELFSLAIGTYILLAIFFTVPAIRRRNLHE